MTSLQFIHYTSAALVCVATGLLSYLVFSNECITSLFKDLWNEWGRWLKLATQWLREVWQAFIWPFAGFGPYTTMGDARRALDEVDARIKADPGYRLVAAGELVKPGDESYSAEFDEWSPATHFIGSRATGYTAIRRLKLHTEEVPVTPAKKSEVAGTVRLHSPGWRYLNEGETIQEGDEIEIFRDTGRTWKACTVAGSVGSIIRKNETEIIRRKIEKYAKTQPEPAEQAPNWQPEWVFREQSPGWRYLDEDEFVQEEDQVFLFDTWYPVSHSFIEDKVPGSQSKEYRRRLKKTYTALIAGDTIQPGDEVNHSRLASVQAWRPVGPTIGHKLNSSDHSNFRRPKFTR